MERFAVGSVPYLNAKPLVKPLIWDGEESPVQVHLEVPSKLPALLKAGTVQAIMVSSISAITDPRATVAAGLSISTQREVLSVRLFSKVPFEKIETLAEDQSSMTSNALAKIILKHKFGVEPQSVTLPPIGDTMLATCDACILIGDNGMRYEGAGLHILDLGEEWHLLTELPFVWAVWKGDETLTSELVAHLQTSLTRSKAQIERVIQEAQEETAFTLDQCAHYIQKIMDYRLDQPHLKAMETFGALLRDQSLIHEAYMPRVIDSPALVSGGQSQTH